MKHEVSAGGIVFKKEDKKIVWLITQHSGHKGWVFPKGLVGDHNPEEKKETAALREVEEEGGVKAKIVYPIPWKTEYFYKFKGSLIKKTVYYYLMEYVSGDPKNHDWEMQDAKFVTEEEVLKTLTYKGDREIFKKAVQKLKELNSSRK